MAAMDDMGEVGETLKSVSEQAREAMSRFAREIELERAHAGEPDGGAGAAAAAGFVLGGGPGRSCARS